jgi:hypothetical protein
MKQPIIEQKNSGSALMTTIIILGLVLGIGVVVSVIHVSEININKDLGDSLTAIYAADTGIEQVLYDIRIGGNIAHYTVGVSTSVNVFIGPSYDIAGAAVTVSAADANSVTLSSRGDFKGTYRAFEVTQPQF